MKIRDGVVVPDDYPDDDENDEDENEQSKDDDSSGKTKETS